MAISVGREILLERARLVEKGLGRGINKLVHNGIRVRSDEDFLTLMSSSGSVSVKSQPIPLQRDEDDESIDCIIDGNLLTALLGAETSETIGFEQEGNSVYVWGVGDARLVNLEESHSIIKEPEMDTVWFEGEAPKWKKATEVGSGMTLEDLTSPLHHLCFDGTTLIVSDKSRGIFWNHEVPFLKRMVLPTDLNDVMPPESSLSIGVDKTGDRLVVVSSSIIVEVGVALSESDESTKYPSERIKQAIASHLKSGVLNASLSMISAKIAGALVAPFTDDTSPVDWRWGGETAEWKVVSSASEQGMVAILHMEGDPPEEVFVTRWPYTRLRSILDVFEDKASVQVQFSTNLSAPIAVLEIDDVRLWAALLAPKS